MILLPHSGLFPKKKNYSSLKDTIVDPLSCSTNFMRVNLDLMFVLGIHSPLSCGFHPFHGQADSGVSLEETLHC